ncbi:MAG: hypothetical protein K2H40_00320, partial [Lachnospiraceae bacterium]|nr:hypothetical protein [Lachnospiraceae bacterium]
MNQDTEKNIEILDMDEQETPVEKTETTSGEAIKAKKKPVKKTAEAAAKKSHLQINLHIIFLSLIVIIIGVIAFKLYKWNKGVPIEDDPNFQESDFDIEVLDSIIPLAPDKLEGHEDDGVTTILCLGNDPFALSRDEDINLANQIAEKSGATVYNGSFWGTTVSALYPTYNDGYWMDALSMSYLEDGICTRDFDDILAAAYCSYDPAFVP